MTLASNHITSGIMYSLSASMGKINPFRTKHEPSNALRGPVRPVGIYFPIPQVDYIIPCIINICFEC